MHIHIAQSDALTAYGPGIDALWSGLLSSRTAIAPTTRFQGRNFSSNLAATIPDLNVAPNQSRAWAMLQKLLTPLIKKLPPQTPLILATTVGEIEFLERAVLENSPTRAADSQPTHLLSRIQSLLHLTGPAFLFSSACASGSAAITRAASMVRHGDAPAVLVIAVDSLSEFVYAGFSSLASLADTPARPFDATRSGLTLGEAAAYVLLQSSSETRPSETRPLGSVQPTTGSPLATEILGWGNTTDAFHMTAPDPAGCGLVRAIIKACKMAGRTPQEISVIAAHGTATSYSDAMEIAAFTQSLPRPVPLFSLKGAIGHTLASAGLLQLLIAHRALALNLIPPTVGLRTPDPAATGWAHPNAIPLALPLVTSRPLALSTNSGFGGVNTAILLGGPP